MISNLLEELIKRRDKTSALSFHEHGLDTVTHLIVRDYQSSERQNLNQAIVCLRQARELSQSNSIEAVRLLTKAQAHVFMADYSRDRCTVILEQ